MLHGSDSVDAANEELQNIFTVEQTLAVIKPDAIDQKGKITQISGLEIPLCENLIIKYL